MKGGLYKMQVIKSVSISQQQAQFIEEMEISASDLLQRSINDIIESSKVSAKQVQELNRKIVILQETIGKQRDFIEAKGLMDAFLGF